MYQLYKLNGKKYQSTIIDLDFDNYVFVYDLEVLSTLLAFDEWPIDKRKAIVQCMRFVYYIEQLSTTRANPLNGVGIPMSKIIEIFNRNTANTFLDILSHLNVVKRVRHADGTFYKKPVKGKSGVTCKYSIVQRVSKDMGVLLVEQKHESAMIYSCDADNVTDNYVSTIFGFDVDYKAALIAELNLFFKRKINYDRLKSRIASLMACKTNRFITNGQNVKRVYHNVTGLSRTSRKHITYQGAPFHKVDMVNCQWLLLAALCKVEGFDVDPDFLERVQGGNFYEYFTETHGWNRDRLKKSLLTQVLFCDDEQRESNLYNLFEQKFPVTMSAIRKLENLYNEKLANKLQNLEAAIFLSVKVGGPYFTIHDAIAFTDNGQEEPIKRQITEILYNMGLRCTLK